ncbi:MAG TPA: hypothetical protein VHU84_15345 [Lacipirellulaceae bacterium]|nr:hypothetical protein [Lacipirellulaceae bacterium]
MILHLFLDAGLVPLLAAGIVTLVATWCGASRSVACAWGSAIGLLAGLVALKSGAGFAPAFRAFALEPHEAADWLPTIIVLALGASIVLLATPQGNRRCWFWLVGYLAAAASLRLLSGNVRLNGAWTPFEKVYHLAILVATFSAVWLLLASAPDDEQSPARFVFLCILAVGSAAALTLAGVFVYGLSCGALAAALVGTALASLMTRAPRGGRPTSRLPNISGAAGIITFSLGSLIILGHYFADLSIASAVLLFASLAAAGAPFPASLPGSTWRQISVRGVACLLPLAIAIKLSMA